MDKGKGETEEEKLAVPVDLVVFAAFELLAVAPVAPAVLPAGPAVEDEFGKNGDAETIEEPPPVLSGPTVLPLGTPVDNEKDGYDMAVPMDLVVVSGFALLPVAPIAPAVLPIEPIVVEFGKSGDADTTEEPPPVLSGPATLPLEPPVERGIVPEELR